MRCAGRPYRPWLGLRCWWHAHLDTGDACSYCTWYSPVGLMTSILVGLYQSSHFGVRFIFLHRPLLEPQGWREGVGERVCARNSQHQDDELVAPRGPPSVRWKQEQVDGIAETPVLPRRRGSTRRGSAAAGCQLAADSCAALVDVPPPIADPVAQHQHGIDVLSLPAHASALEPCFDDHLVGAFHAARANRPACLLIGGVLHVCFTLLQVGQFLLDG